MKVYKFGGASVSSAQGVRNFADIISGEKGKLFIIVSAMGKTTNALEGVVEAFYNGDRTGALERLERVVEYHDNIMGGLWDRGLIPAGVGMCYRELENIVRNGRPGEKSYEAWYDRIVGYGELISTEIVSGYLTKAGIKNRWVDMRGVFITSDRHKDANIDIAASAPLLRKIVETTPVDIFIGQGFIGATAEGVPTTIGREGSDYSAAVAGYILDAESVSIWKDVEGILNADPKFFAEAEYIPEMTYQDAIELAYSGAQIIHPKTIKPLQNKHIPLYVKCFCDKARPGSIIKDTIKEKINIPILILKQKQTLLTIRPHDFSFVLEERFAEIFSLLQEFHVKLNLIQSSAVNLTISMDESRYMDEIAERLRERGYWAKYNTGMELLTIRGYTPALRAKYGEGADVYLTQRTRKNIRIVRKTAIT